MPSFQYCPCFFFLCPSSFGLDFFFSFLYIRPNASSDHCTFTLKLLAMCCPCFEHSGVSVRSKSWDVMNVMIENVYG